MPAEQGVGSRRFHPLQCCEGIHVRQQILVLTVGAAVNEQQSVAPQCHGQAGQERLVVIRHPFSSPVMRPMTASFSQLGRVAAFAGIEAIDDVFIPAALTGGYGTVTHQLHHFIGLRSVAHQIAETCDCFNPLAVDVVKDGLNRGEVGMQAGHNSVSHGLS